MANEDWDQIELQDDPEACTFKATIHRLKVQKEPPDLADPLTLTVNKIRQDERIEADLYGKEPRMNTTCPERSRTGMNTKLKPRISLMDPAQPSAATKKLQTTN